MTLSDEIEAVSTDLAPNPAGHYSQAVVHAGLVYISGQLPVSSNGDDLTSANFDCQARKVMENLLAILGAAGSSPKRLLKVTAYIVGVEHWPEFNAIYADCLGDVKPARSVVPVHELHHGYLVEVDAIAAIEIAEI